MNVILLLVYLNLSEVKPYTMVSHGILIRVVAFFLVRLCVLLLAVERNLRVMPCHCLA
jgi:hypothetical protein